jgi:AhpD family alkylhydroperoxidase
VSERIQFHEALPETYKRLLNLNQHVERMATERSVDPRLVELVKIRCSQVNGCAFCVDLHVGRAVDLGESERRLLQLPTWRESGLFDDAERAALALAEAVCNLPSTREVPDEVYDEALRALGAERLPVVVWAVAEIQAFNALNVTSRKPLPR